MKVNLAENMLRFGVKNLNKTATSKVKTLAEQETPTTAEPTPQQAASAYEKYKNDMWRTIFKNIAIPAQRSQENVKNKTVSYDWRYPQDQMKGQFKDTMQNTYTIGTDADAFDIEFKKRLTQALGDNNWLTRVANELNALFGNVGTNNPNDTVIEVQTYIKNRFPKGDKRVEDNGTPGRRFNDGVFYAHSTRAYIQLIINSFQPHKILELTSTQA